jgi:hypothetical protein
VRVRVCRRSAQDPQGFLQPTVRLLEELRGRQQLFLHRLDLPSPASELPGVFVRVLDPMR